MEFGKVDDIRWEKAETSRMSLIYQQFDDLDRFVGYIIAPA
jgi:hypothetical protein